MLLFFSSKIVSAIWLWHTYKYKKKNWRPTTTRISVFQELTTLETLKLKGTHVKTTWNCVVRSNASGVHVRSSYETSKSQSWQKRNKKKIVFIDILRVYRLNFVFRETLLDLTERSWSINNCFRFFQINYLRVKNDFCFNFKKPYAWRIVFCKYMVYKKLTVAEWSERMFQSHGFDPRVVSKIFFRECKPAINYQITQPIR